MRICLCSGGAEVRDKLAVEHLLERADIGITVFVIDRKRFEQTFFAYGLDLYAELRGRYEFVRFGAFRSLGRRRADETRINRSAYLVDVRPRSLHAVLRIQFERGVTLFEYKERLGYALVIYRRRAEVDELDLFVVYYLNVLGRNVFVDYAVLMQQ